MPSIQKCVHAFSIPTLLLPFRKTDEYRLNERGEMQVRNVYKDAHITGDPMLERLWTGSHSKRNEHLRRYELVHTEEE